MFAFIVSILAQFEGASVAESDAVSTAYKFNVETLCGVLILLMFGIGIGIWVAFKNIQHKKKHHHHHHHHHHSSSSSSEKKEEDSSDSS
ncbi:MAG: hypothetical protein IKS95_05030, partial [Verrucomicrobia bacterium]|nr:hypothetical protein [Verrucomicrobiota bacterium]